MRNEYRAVFLILGKLGVFIGKRNDGASAASHLKHIDEVSLVVHMKHGLNAKHIANEGNGGTDTPAALQVYEIVHGKPVAKLRTKSLNIATMMGLTSLRSPEQIAAIRGKSVEEIL